MLLVFLVMGFLVLNTVLLKAEGFDFSYKNKWFVILIITTMNVFLVEYVLNGNAFIAIIIGLFGGYVFEYLLRINIGNYELIAENYIKTVARIKQKNQKG